MSNEQSPKVGYKCPPKHTQFRKGRSGNPRGRPKKVVEEKFASDRQLRDDFLAHAVQDIKVTVNGKQTTMPAIHGVYQKQFAKALAGDTRAAEFCDARYARYMVAEGNALADLFQAHEDIEAFYRNALRTEPSAGRLVELRKQFEAYKNSPARKQLFERMNSPIQKFKA
jgi:hypothetical protein